jgi:predicted O-methyltransferase YrrM
MFHKDERKVKINWRKEFRMFLQGVVGYLKHSAFAARIRPSVRRLTQARRLYAAALEQLRRVRMVAKNATFDEAYAFAEAEIGIVQKREDIQWLFELVRAARPRIVLEIGLDLGGTFFLWSRAAAPDAHLLAIDTRPPGRLGVWSAFPLVRRGFAVGAQRVSLLMGRDSHSETTFRRVATLLGARSVEFLFIDGDHSRDGVCQDFHTYSALVAPGGLIAFHDISPNPAEWTQGVARFWREFTAEHETTECMVSDEAGFGIGVYRAPGSLARRVGPSRRSVNFSNTVIHDPRC